MDFMNTIEYMRDPKKPFIFKLLRAFDIIQYLLSNPSALLYILARLNYWQTLEAIVGYILAFVVIGSWIVKKIRDYLRIQGNLTGE